VSDPIPDLHAALSELLGAERRLRGRQKGELTVMHVRAMMWLARNDRGTPGQLARETDLNPASVTGLVDQLVSTGLVRRERSEEDRRVVLVSMTDAGRDVVAAKRAQWESCWRAALADVPDADLETAAEVMRRVAALYDSLQRSAPV
jgi:DNA-binding MarR family transcriptional regulator